MHSFIWGSKSFLSSEGTWAHVFDPKMRKWFTFGFLLLHASKGVIYFIDLWVDQFFVYMAQLTSSTKIFEGRYFAWIMQLAIYFRYRFFLSATPFDCGVYGVVCYKWILDSSQICCKSFFTYSPTLYIHMISIIFPDYFFACGLKSLRSSNNFIFFPEKVHLRVPWLIINESQHISVLAYIWMR